MLTHIHIKNFAIIDELNLDIKKGMTVLTGETGAGKSIIMDALELALGQRANNDVIRHGCERAEICVTFNLTEIKNFQSFFEKYDFENNEECFIRRVIHRDGHSKCYINGSPATLQQIRELTENLINIHGQHEFQSLLYSEKQRELLDDFAQHTELLKKVMQLYKLWQQKNTEYETLCKTTQDILNRSEFLRYQIKELDELNLVENEIEQINQEHKQLSNADTLLTNCQLAISALDNDEHDSASPLINRASQALAQINHIDETLQNATSLLNNAIVSIDEAIHELKNYLEKINLNPSRLTWLEQRLSAIHQAARKHRIKPEDLLSFHQQLCHELKDLETSDENLNTLQKEIEKIKNEYFVIAQQLSKSREKYAKQLSQLITKNFQQLGMTGGKFEIQFEKQNQEQPILWGLEKIKFMVNTNPGQPLQLLNKVASGGELSRISLAIQVITAEHSATPTLFFDEVDSGIGGATAEIVGDLLQKLGKKTQVFCITHLAQVAAKGHHHLYVEKVNKNNLTKTELSYLDEEQQINEIARMMGGLKITSQTLAHAKEIKHGDKK